FRVGQQISITIVSDASINGPRTRIKIDLGKPIRITLVLIIYPVPIDLKIADDHFLLRQKCLL
ncbi:MAG: hypothetical protein AAF573_17555, partial [Bacteroidota bacterium]